MELHESAGFWFAGVLGNAGLVRSLQDPRMLEHSWEGESLVGAVLEKLHVEGGREGVEDGWGGGSGGRMGRGEGGSGVHLLVYSIVNSLHC